MAKQIGSILDLVGNVIKGVGTPTAADHAAPRGYVDTGLGGKANTSHTHPVGDLTATGTKDTTTFLRGDNTWNVPPGAGGGAPSGAAGGDLGSTYPNPTVVKSLADFAVGGNLTVGSGLGQVIIPISGSTAKGRLQSLPSTPNWLGYTLNCAYSGSGWLLDDTSIPGWFFKLDSRAASIEYAVYFIPAGANPHTDEHFVFKVDSTNLMTVAGRITGVGAPSAASDAIRHDDTRLSNARTPTAHTHPASDVASGVVDVARLGTTPAATEYLRSAGATGSADWVAPATVKTDLALVKGDVGLGLVQNTDQTNATNITSGTLQDVNRIGQTPTAASYLRAAGTSGLATWTNLAGLKSDLAYTKADFGLGNVDNTSDVNKPVSTATTNAMYVNAFKNPCLVATTTNLAALSGLAAIDGVTPVAGDRILVKNQTTTAQNGIYVAASGAWSRAPDNNTAALMASAATTVLSGGTGTGRTYQNKFKSTDTLGTTGIDFWYLVDNLAGSILYASATPGAGLAATGNTLSIGVGGVTSNMLQDNEITATDINSAYKDGAIGTPSLRTLGTGALQAMPGNTTLAPIGSIVEWPTATPPTGWLLCNGNPALTTTYATLFGVLGTSYGNGDGSGNQFNLPTLGPTFNDNAALTQAQVVSATATGYTFTLTYGALKSGMVHLYLTIVRTGVTVALANPNHAQQNVGTLTANFAPVNSVGLAMANAPRWGDLRNSGTVNLLAGLANSSYTSSNITQNDSYSASVVYPMNPASTLPKIYYIIRAL